MAKFFDKFKEMMRLDEDEYEEYDEYEEFEQKPPKKEAPRVSSQPSFRSYEPSYKSKSNNVVNLKTNVQLGMVVIQPTSYDDARTVSDHLKSYRPVIINLEALDNDMSRRIMDFVYGSCYTLRGTSQRISEKIFIIAPENVEISGDIKKELKNKGILLPWQK